jgi:hypothetical protein
VELACHSCRWSACDASSRLFCQLSEKPCNDVCGLFEYEPGTDEQELRDVRAHVAGREAHAEGRYVLRADLSQVSQRDRAVRLHAVGVDRRAVRAGTQAVEG